MTQPGFYCKEKCVVSFSACKLIPFFYVGSKTFFRSQLNDQQKLNIHEKPPADVWNKLQSNLFCWTCFDVT